MEFRQCAHTAPRVPGSEEVGRDAGRSRWAGGSCGAWSERPAPGPPARETPTAGGDRPEPDALLQPSPQHKGLFTHQANGSEAFFSLAWLVLLFLNTVFLIPLNT